ncbi:MAG: Mut7-C RNAse domain-containing protein [Thermoplasmata archaeon]
MSTDTPRTTFIADHMLGSLARWLRMMGYDCRYEKGLSDDEILDISEKEARVILTRDEELAERGNGFCLRTTSLDEQLLELGKRFGLRFDPSSMRCSLCNGSLMQIDKSAAAGKVPEKSLQHATEFWQCVSCKKIYWDGTHWSGIIGRFEKLGLTGGGK